MRVSRLLLVWAAFFCSPWARGDPLQHEFLLMPSALAGGLAPKLTNGGLQPFDLVHPDSGRRPGDQARASLHPGEFSDSGFGLVNGHFTDVRLQ
jgi:hypothetical protein